MVIGVIEGEEITERETIEEKYPRAESKLNFQVKRTQQKPAE